MRKLIAGLTSKLRPASPALAITCAILFIVGLAGYATAQRVQAPGNTAIVCAYNSSPPTLTSGWFGYAQCDSSGKLITSAGGGGGSAVTIADGADVAEGATTDAAATQGSTGTVSAKLRTVTSQLNTIAVTGIPVTSTPGVGATGSAATANAQQTGALTGSATTGGKLQNVIQCDNHVFKHITSATDTLAVQGVTSQIIYICAWRSRAAGDATWYLENTASVNANCSSSNTQLTGVATETANSGEVFAPPFWTGLKNTVSNGLCINSTGTGGVDIDIWYTQF